MTPIEIVQEEGQKFGRKISDEDADWILWEHTGFPCWWSSESGNSSEECLRTQVCEFLESCPKPEGGGE